MIEQQPVQAPPHFVQPVLQINYGINMKELIGSQHLFGRLCDTREGFIIVPIGFITLQADGRVTGHSHPNEGLWRPYQFGAVSQEKAFAFVGADNKFIPSSTWQQTYAGIPIGFYCGEPEMPQKLCLLPNSEKQENKHVVYLIASCFSFYKQTIPRLIKELLAEGIDAKNIKVVVNGSRRDEETTIQGISHAFTTHNAWELSALYEAPLRWQFDYAMLIHDTNYVYPGFKRKVESFNQYLEWEFLPATPQARCLLGLYSCSFLRRQNEWLKGTDGISKTEAIIAEVAGELLHRAKTVLVMGDLESNGSVRNVEWRETADFFNTGTMRVRRVFPAINLHKFTHTGLTDPLQL